MIEFTTLDIFLNLTLAAMLGLLLGTERSVAGKKAGMRTFSLVSLGSALFVTTAVLITDQYLGRINIDPLRILSAIVTGVGFIGTGLIIFRNDALRGLTTAASLWVSAGVGATVGFGYHSVAVFATLLTLFIFTAIWFAENKLKLTVDKNEPTVVESTITKEEEIDE